MSEAVTPQKTARLQSLIRSAANIAVVTHTHPDGDALGSATAMASYLGEVCGKKATVFLANEAPDTISFILEDITPVVCDNSPAGCASQLSACDLVICLDFNSFSRTDSLEPLLRECTAPKVLIDHHIGPDTACFDLVISETEISSASELLFQVLMATDPIAGNASRLPGRCARALMSGMTTDTNNFANSVFPSTLLMASQLLEAGVDRDAIVARIYNRYRPNRVAAISALLHEHMTIRPDGVAFIVVTKALWQQFGLREGELEGMVNIPLTIDNVNFSIYLREDDGHFRVSIRSKRGYSANLLARRLFHGGGHEQAAGGKLYFPQDIAEPSLAAQYLNNIEV